MTHDTRLNEKTPSTNQSPGSSVTHVQVNEKLPPENAVDVPTLQRMTSNGQCESALAADKIEEALENMDEDWENDPENARNWTSGKKWAAVSIVSAYCFVSPLASSMMAPGLGEVAIKFGITNPTVIAMTLCIFLLSFAIGPLILAPLSEMYGRTWVLHISSLFTMAFCFACAFAPDTGSLIAFRFLSRRLYRKCPVACGGGSVSDMFAERDRAMAMGLFSLGPLIGPIVGPVAGGFLAQSVGIKWVFIVIGTMCGVATAVGIPLLRETYAPVIRLRRAMKAGDPELAAKAHHLLAERGNKMHALWINLSRPVTILCTSFVCFILSLYMAFMYGIFYLMFATFAALFRNTYGFKAGVGGLAYLGLGFGFITATAFGTKVADMVYKRLAERNGGVATPEMRIPALFFGSFFVPVGLFWYGWSAQVRLHWIMPIIGSGIFGFGMMTTFMPINLYLVDSFTYAASAIAASSLFRSLLGFAFPLFGSQMFEALGLGGGNSLLAGLSIVLGIPFPVWIYFKGAELRAKNVHTRESTVPKQLMGQTSSRSPRS